MKCRRIREILMEYIDAELDDRSSREVMGHLEGCSACRALEADLRRGAITPLRSAKRLEAPAGMWLKVKTAIEASIEPRRIRGFLPEFAERFKATFTAVRKPAFALAGGLAILVFAAILLWRVFMGGDMLTSYLEEDAQFLSYLTSENGTLDPYGDEIDLGTAVERYIL